jgi:phage/plasmid primase-like uncharacterized protein
MGLDLTSALDALSHISANIDYKDWSNIGRALASEFGDDARDGFESWSEGGDSYNSREFNAQWNSFKRTKKVNISTLIYHAKQAGWSPEKSEPLSDIEKQRLKNERAERRKVREQKAERAAHRKNRRSAAFYSSLPALAKHKNPSPYQVDKHLEDAQRFSEFKEYHSTNGRRKKHLLVIPLRDIEGNWRGAELIHAWRKTRNQKTGKLRHFRRTMTGTEPALGFHVFPNHDALKTAKRVFITEGWADGVWAHKASGEVTAYVIGSHNVPTIAGIIQQAYPDCQVITAADNDKAGKAATTAHGGYWTMPLAQNDWSDVAAQEGADSLKAQLLNIRGFQKCLVNERYLGNATGAKIRPGLNLVKSAKETGKSSWIIEFMNNNLNLSVLVISYRKNLVNQLAQKAGVDYYEDLINVDRFGNFSNVELRKSSRLAISPDSLYKLIEKGTVRPYDVVFVDECDQTLMHYDADTMKNKEKNFGVMSWLLKHSQYQVLADADLSDLTIEYCNDIGLNRGQFIINEFKPRQGSDMFLYHHNMHLRDALLRRAAVEPIFYCSNSKERVLEVERLLQAAGINETKIQAIHSGNSGTAEIQQFIVDINNQVNRLHVLLASPSMGTGVSIDEGHPFKAVFAEFSHRTGTAEQAHQQMARTRAVTEYHVFVDPTFHNFETNPDELRRVMLDKPELDSEHLFTFDIHQGEMVARNPEFEALHCRIRAFRNLNRNCFAERFIQQAEAEGYAIQKVAFNEDAAEVLKDKTDLIREELTAELRERIYDDEQHPILSDDDFKAAELGSISVSEESRLKTKVMKSLALADYLRYPSLVKPEVIHDMVKRLAFMEATEGYVNGIKKLSVIAQPENVAILRDIEDRKFAESRAGLKHFTAQRRHELRFLKAVGIDENLNFNGKVWQSKEVANAMRQYLKKHKDEIQAYSGSTITAKTLKDPIRWFCDHLKAMNVPLVAFQRRVSGKQVWFRTVDEQQWKMVTRLVKSRVRGLTAYYAEKGEELGKITVQKPVVQQVETVTETVTQNALVYNNTDGSHVTAKSPANLYVARLKADPEGQGKTTIPPAELNNNDLAVSPFEKFIDSVSEPSSTQRERLKLAEVFPAAHKAKYNAGLMSDKDLRSWIEYGASGAFRTAVFNVASAVKHLMPGCSNLVDEVMGRFTAEHAREFCKGALSVSDLVAVIRNG